MSNLEETREKTNKAFRERIEKDLSKGHSIEVVRFTIERAMANSAISFLMAGGSPRDLVTEYTLLLAEVDKLIGAVED